MNDPKFLTAFYYSLRNTLVANDLEQATRIAYGGGQRNRVVTLKGEIIEVSGTMSGGGNPSRGRMGSKITAVDEMSAETIKKMQETIKVDENLLSQLRARKQELETLIHELKTKLEKSNNDLVKWQNELNSLKEMIKLGRTTEASLEKRIKELTPDPDTRQKMEDTLEKYREQFDDADRAAFQLREENEELHKKILEISKKILDGPKANVKKIENGIEEAKTQITNLNVEIKTSKRNLVNSEKKLASYKEDLEQHEENLDKFQKRLESIDEEGKELVQLHETTKKGRFLRYLFLILFLFDHFLNVFTNP